MQAKIAVIGDRGSVLGFKAAGFDIFEADASQAPDIIVTLAERGYGIIFITEESAALSEEVIESYRSSALPAVILIPGKSGSTGIGTYNIHRSVEKAVGTDIFHNRQG